MIFFKEKIALLTEQITVLGVENSQLKKKVVNLEQELGRVKPKGELAEDTVKVLRLLFEHDGLTDSQISQALSMSQGMVEYHTGALRGLKMISYPMIRTLGRENPNCMLQKGREYLVTNGLV